MLLRRAAAPAAVISLYMWWFAVHRRNQAEVPRRYHNGIYGFYDGDNSYASPAKDSGFSEGDRIVAINGIPVNSVDDMQEVLDKLSTSSAKVTIENSEGRSEKTIRLCRDSETKHYRMGIWAKDTAAGIGTLTFYSEECHMYGALGHAITDNGTKYEISGGSLQKAEITGIKKALPAHLEN